MKTRKVILNNDGKQLSKTQAKKEAEKFVQQQVSNSFAAGDSSVDVDFDAVVDGEITLRDLLERSFA